jgi:ABC-2 type transport system ATP-binding protein
MLTIQNLVKSYSGRSNAVDHVSMELGTGVLGLIGHNGAGKTTLLNMICTLSRPSSGRILFNGVDIVQQPDAMRRRLGFLPQEFGAPANLRARDFLLYLAALKGVRDTGRVQRCLEMVNLHEFAQRRMGDFSGGMRRRLGIAQALLGDPDVLIVDEPTTGLDLDERLRFRSLMAEIGSGKLVIISTHIVSDVEHIATELAVMSTGRLVTHASPQAIMAMARGAVWSALVDAGQYAELRTRVQILQVRTMADGMQLRMAHPQRPCTGALPQEPTLEDALMLLPRGRLELAA